MAWECDGCDESVTGNSHSCADDNCTKQLCETCLFDCEDCGDSFCEAHLQSDRDPLEGMPIYLCFACVEKGKLLKKSVMVPRKEAA